MKNQRLAAIDIGSNSIKLAVIEAAASDSFTVILQERERVRLGQETLRSKILSAEAIARSAEAVAKFRAIAENREAENIIAVATASVREADNAAEFVKEIEAKTGIRVEVLSSIEEARLIGLAVVQNKTMLRGSLLNVDIGGGSTELSLMTDGTPEELFSMKLGAVGLSERFIFSNPPKDKEIKGLRNEISALLERPARELKNKKWQLSTGTSGTILNLSSLLNFQTAENSDKTPEINYKRLVGLNQMLSRISLEEKAKLPSISLQRAEVIVAGGQILEGVMRELKINTLYPCTYALREGVIIDYLREIEAESLPPVPDVEDANLRGVFAIGRRFGYEENHALQVAFVAEKIFDALALTYKFGRQQRTMLSVAALLHDIGYHISHESHHKHTLYLIKHSELTGFSENEKLIIANVARYYRGSLPKEKHTDFMALSEKDREIVWMLGGILRLADALDRSYESKVRNLNFTRTKQGLNLELVSDKNCETELQAAEQKKDMFETAFTVKLEISHGKSAARA